MDVRRSLARPRFALPFVIGLAAVLAACPAPAPGGPTPSPGDTEGETGGGSTADFIEAADAICLDADTEVHEIATSFGPVESAEDDAAVLADVIPLREAEVEALAELEVPDEISDDFQAYLEARRTVNETLVERRTAGEEGNEEENLELGDRSLAERREANAIAADIGLTTCAHQLPEEDAEEVQRIAELYFTSEDASICADYLTPGFLEQVGGLETCEEDQVVDRGTESVELEVISGISGIRATVGAVPEGGPNDGVSLEVDFVYEDGWKISGIFLAEE